MGMMKNNRESIQASNKNYEDKSSKYKIDETLENAMDESKNTQS